MAINDLLGKNLSALGLGLILSCSGAADESTGCKNDSECKGNRYCIDGECVEESGNSKDTYASVDTAPPAPEKQCYGPWLWQECQQGDYGNCQEWSETYTCPTSTICKEGVCEEIVWNCYNGSALKLNKVCDGSEDCPMGDDEEGCYDNFGGGMHCADLQYCFEGKFGAPKYCTPSNDYSKDQNCWAKCWAVAPAEIKEKWVNTVSCINLNCGGVSYSDECAAQEIGSCTFKIDDSDCGYWSPIGKKSCQFGEYIPEDEWCDGSVDCSNGFDEEWCT